MAEELLLIESTRRPTARELRWIHLKFERTRNVLRARARLPIGCLCLVIPVLSLILKLSGMGFWAWALAIACVFSIMSLNGNWRARRKIGRMANLVENGMVQETRVVSNRCFELWVGEGGEDGSFLHFFDLGERG